MKKGSSLCGIAFRVYHRVHLLQTLHIAMAKAMKAMKVMKKMAAMKAMKVMKKKAAMKAMKVMKKKAAMKAMKAMKKKAVSKIATGSHAKAMVLRGTKAKTTDGLTASDLIRNKAGKIVSKKKSATAKKAFKNTVGPWCQALAKARKALKITGFVAVKKGTPLYAKAKELYTQ